jgi:acylphosphatase
MKCVRVRIEGRVQGVAYRAWTERRACELALSGWVRNRLDGSVEALFCGPGEVVEQMIAACHKGPAAATVSSVQVLAEGEPAPVRQIFQVRPSE